MTRALRFLAGLYLVQLTAGVGLGLGVGIWLSWHCAGEFSCVQQEITQWLP